MSTDLSPIDFLAFSAIGWVLLFPLLCAALGEYWDFGWVAGALTGLLLGPVGPFVLWYIERSR